MTKRSNDGLMSTGWRNSARDGSDFEDNLHIACAMEARLDASVTRNPKDFDGSPIPVLTPAELLAILAQDSKA
jgi:hypothetical protein